MREPTLAEALEELGVIEEILRWATHRLPGAPRQADRLESLPAQEPREQTKCGRSSGDRGYPLQEAR
jgi:hypothetical protein